jgi:hypothetical protein
MLAQKKIAFFGFEECRNKLFETFNSITIVQQTQYIISINYSLDYLFL